MLVNQLMSNKDQTETRSQVLKHIYETEMDFPKKKKKNVQYEKWINSIIKLFMKIKLVLDDLNLKLTCTIKYLILNKNNTFKNITDVVP